MLDNKENVHVDFEKVYSLYMPASLNDKLFELTEQASNVRSLLEKKQIENSISARIAISNNKDTLVNETKRSFLECTKYVTEEILRSFKTKFDEFKQEIEVINNMNILRSTEANKAILVDISTIIVDQVRSILLEEDTLKILKSKLTDKIEQQSDQFIEQLSEIRNTWNKEDKLVDTIKNIANQFEEKERHIHVNHIQGIQRQYEAVVRDLRRRCFFLEQSMQEKELCELSLKSEINELSKDLSDTRCELELRKDELINCISQKRQIQDDLDILYKRYAELEVNSENLIKLQLSDFEKQKTRYLRYGVAIDSIQHLFYNISISRMGWCFSKLKIFHTLPDHRSENLINGDVETSGNLEIASSPNFLSKLKSEDTLASLLVVEKRIEDEEKEQNLIALLLNMLNGGIYSQITQLSRLFNIRRRRYIKWSFNKLRSN
ncbi:hypothetical protein cand_015700 [Cryptosporidium andersoni]|uniref:Uncharacterized protein n=1 Tax=Cryptosporidium andersoni TaxID=117008 RepID=A0A1J4MU35_9CRYT|nr:hypothetical protein cand_015700 [Cryptosporidium andersoni]